MPALDTIINSLVDDAKSMNSDISFDKISVSSIMTESTTTTNNSAVYCLATKYLKQDQVP